MFRARTAAKSARIIIVPPKRLVERESTGAVPPAGELVRQAMDFINANACKGLKPDEVAAHLRCSRALLDLRFRERSGSTVRQAIENRKLKEVRRLLKNTGRPLKAIAAQCGFSSECRLSHLFVQRFGVAPIAWRRQQT